MLGAIGVASVGLLVIGGVERFQGELKAKRAQAEQSRAERVQPVMAVAPAPLPTGLPLVERAGKDAFGYPRSYVDGPALRSLLHHERYQELSRYLEQFQSEFEADPLKELLPIRAAEAFQSADPALLPKLMGWLAATPNSFAPHLALGAHWADSAMARRGGKLATDTQAQDFAAMREAAQRANQELERALELAPKLVAAQRIRIQVATVTSDEKRADEALAAAVAACPGCFSVRVSYLHKLEPRWGGSLAAMIQFAGRVPSDVNARLKLLPGYVLDERAVLAVEKKQLDLALQHMNEACALGDHWDFLDRRAAIQLEKGQVDAAKKDWDLAIEISPELPRLKIARAKLLANQKAWESAARDLIDAARVDATDSTARWLLPRIARGLSSEGWAAHQRGDRATAVRLLELGQQLSPFDRELHERQEQAVRGGATGAPNELAALEASVKAQPDDFAARQQLDYALAKTKQYPRVIELWTEYLVRHPEDARAYMERSGAYYNSGHVPEATADVSKACGLGLDQACAYEKRIKSGVR